MVAGEFQGRLSFSDGCEADTRDDAQVNDRLVERRVLISGGWLIKRDLKVFKRNKTTIFAQDLRRKCEMRTGSP